MKPNPSELTKWINALRSGKYAQGQFLLQSGANKYCCLGVACKELIKRPKKDLHTNYLIGELVTMAEQPNAPGWLYHINTDFNGIMDTKLSMLNDRESSLYGNRFSFDEIADLIQLVYIEKALD